jgi:hypothetical protein
MGGKDSLDHRIYYLVKIKCQIISHAVRCSISCKDRIFWHLALVGLFMQWLQRIIYRYSKLTRVMDMPFQFPSKTFIHNIIPSIMQLFPLLLPFTECFGLKRSSSDVSAMPELFHCIERPLSHITYNCDISWSKILKVIIDYQFKVHYRVW